MPAQAGVQALWQAPVVVLHTVPGAHVPHVPPQPSGPQLFPPQLGVQLALHCPLTHACPGHFPQLPPQPSSPQTFPAQAGVQLFAHFPEAHCCEGAQLPHELPQPSSPQTLPVQSGVQVAVHFVPFALQNWSPQQMLQNWPQPSGPQTLPAQSGWHAPLESGPPASWPPGSLWATDCDGEEAQPIARHSASKTAIGNFSTTYRLRSMGALANSQSCTCLRTVRRRMAIHLSVGYVASHTSSTRPMPPSPSTPRGR